ncbi:nitronate monooxygenase [Ramlibacter sp.]|uniref:nitronate monooxygenase n=1 Tax=Ramlibacter sp. TaxID=1917967 RepID=UPI003D0F9946
MKTQATELFGIETPLFAFSHCRDVVAEATRAGGMGVLGAMTHTPQELKIDLDWIAERTGGKPFGVDVLMPASEGGEAPKLDLSILEKIPKRHFEFVESVLARHGVPDIPQDEKDALLRHFIDELAFTVEGAQRRLDVVFDHPSVKFVVSALGPAPADVVARARARGMKIGGMVGSAKHAKRHVAAGADIVIASGYEAAGHTGEVTTMILVPEIADAIAPVPVLAAGGIGRGRQLAAALALGAQGAWCGTVWLGTVESDATPEVKARLFASSAEETQRTRCNTGKPARRLSSAWVEAWNAPDAPPPLPMPLQGVLTHVALKRIERARREDLVSWAAGQVAGQLTGETTVRTIYREMLEEFSASVERLEAIVAG